jgi:response regulator of citrate/malate metabolism
VHIIAISSDMSAKNITKFSDLGVKYFLPKPLNTTKFKSVVEEILRKTDAKKKEQKAHENDE